MPVQQVFGLQQRLAMQFCILRRCRSAHLSDRGRGKRKCDIKCGCDIKAITVYQRGSERTKNAIKNGSNNAFFKWHFKFVWDFLVMESVQSCSYSRPRFSQPHYGVEIEFALWECWEFGVSYSSKTIKCFENHAIIVSPSIYSFDLFDMSYKFYVEDSYWHHPLHFLDLGLTQF